MINLNGLRMNAVQTAVNGVVNIDTIFEFKQDENRVTASYSGGKVIQGFLTGLISGDTFEFRYCQLEEGDVLNGGHSNCEVKRSSENLIQILEYFEWESQSGKGLNIIQELP